MDGYAAGAKSAFGALTDSAKVQFGNTTTNSYVLPLIASIIGLALIGIVVYIILQIRSSKPQQTVMGPVDLFKPTSPIVIDRNTTKSAMTATYTLAFYLRVDAVPDMRSDATPLFTWPGIWDLNYNAANEQLQWVVRQTFDGKTGILGPEKIHLSNVPLQKWTQITVAFEGRTFDLYVNGKLMKSHTLENMPPSGASSITIVPGGMLGQIAYVQLWSRRLTVSDTNSNYLDTSDSQGRPFLGPEFLRTLANIQIPNLFCPSGNCAGAQPTANASQKWEFPYA